MRNVLLLAALLLAATAVEAAPRRIALRPIPPSDGLKPSDVALLNDAVAAELRRQPNTQIITQTEIAALLSYEQQKQYLGCSEDACAADLGGALGCEELIIGSIGVIGRSWMVNLRRLNIVKVVTTGQADRRLKNASIDDVLDTLPILVRELFPESAPAPAPAAAQAPASPALGTAGPKAAAMPLSWAEVGRTSDAAAPAAQGPLKVLPRPGSTSAAPVTAVAMETGGRRKLWSALGLTAAAAVATGVLGVEYDKARTAEADALAAYRSAQTDAGPLYDAYSAARDNTNEKLGWLIAAGAVTALGAGASVYFLVTAPVRPAIGSAGDIGVAGSF
jgi:hypothetical protein